MGWEKPTKIANASPFVWYMDDLAEWSDEPDPRLESKPVMPWYPLLEQPALFRRFAAISKNKEDFADFALYYGPLRSLDSSDRLSDWMQEHEALYRAIGLFDAFLRVPPALRLSKRDELIDAVRRGMQRNPVHPVLVPSGSPVGVGLKIAYTPDSLAGAMWLQLALAIEGNLQYAVCEYCGKWFETSRPEEAKICSEKCRNARNYRKRKGEWKGGETTNGQTSER
jgi:hypothetical protein